jgi:hypothetical protein
MTEGSQLQSGNPNLVSVVACTSVVATRGTVPPEAGLGYEQRAERFFPRSVETAGALDVG